MCEDKKEKAAILKQLNAMLKYVLTIQQQIGYVNEWNRGNMEGQITMLKYAIEVVKNP
jgi:DUF1680 family protein